MEAMALDNDTRGWILTGLSAFACILGAAGICVDIPIRALIPGKKHFKIQDSNSFLSCSLSLSAGVMLFSALYKMLPSSKSSLQDAGFSSSQASWILIGCFLGGVFGIQILSGILHRFIPSHTVDCDHEHESENHGHDHHDHHEHHSSDHSSRVEAKTASNGHAHEESTPLLNGPRSQGNGTIESQDSLTGMSGNAGTPHRPSFQSRVSATMSKFVSRKKQSCDADGPCLGYTDPCGKDCFRNIQSRGGTRTVAQINSLRRPTAALRHSTAGILHNSIARPVPNTDEEAHVGMAHSKASGGLSRKFSDTAVPSVTISDEPNTMNVDSRTQASRSLMSSHIMEEPSHDTADHAEDDAEPDTEDQGPHHHHVPQNAFLAISLQTSIAIALHKLPEGFITYATNHANPKLGFAVFLALAIHNVSEGFALALPLYLATESRLKALLYSVVLGGASQPMGAGIAALWLSISERGRGGHNASEQQQGVYGAMFAITAGIMASVALSLLQESNELGHNKGLCMVFTFVGMGILGMSSALNG